MKVWLVEKGYDYEGSDVIGVFSTEEKALAFIAQLAAEGTGGAKIKRYPMDVDVADKEQSRG